MVEIPNKIFNRAFEEIEVGVSTLNFFSKPNFENAQVQYKVEETKPKTKYVGKEFVVIGNEASLNEPIIAKIDDEKIPIYKVFKNSANSLEKVADSCEQYYDVLGKIKETDLYRRDKVNNLLSDIEKIVPQDSMYYWNDLINSAYNYYADTYED